MWPQALSHDRVFWASLHTTKWSWQAILASSGQVVLLTNRKAERISFVHFCAWVEGSVQWFQLVLMVVQHLNWRTAFPSHKGQLFYIFYMLARSFQILRFWFSSMAEPDFPKTYHHSQPVQDSGPRPHIIETRVSFMRVLCLKANAPFFLHIKLFYFSLTLKVSTWINAGGNSFKDLAYLGLHFAHVEWLELEFRKSMPEYNITRVVASEQKCFQSTLKISRVLHGFVSITV